METMHSMMEHLRQLYCHSFQNTMSAWALHCKFMNNKQ